MKNQNKGALAFQFIKDRARFLNKSEVEKECGITRTALGNAINRDQKNFKDSDKLIPFLDQYFNGWEKL